MDTTRERVKHSPLPWHMTDKTIYADDQVVPICEILNRYKPEREADKAFIVRAVNCHDDLLAACELWLSDDYADNENGFRDKARAAGRAAIARARS